MSKKNYYYLLDGTSYYEDTRTLAEAHEENISRIREWITHKIHDAGYDEIWQRNASLGLVDNAEEGKAFIANIRSAYHDYKKRLLASTRDAADSIEFKWNL
jgi:hypothetical protein